VQSQYENAIAVVGQSTNHRARCILASVVGHTAPWCHTGCCAFRRPCDPARIQTGTHQLHRELERGKSRRLFTGAGFVEAT
jgi:hypothetical protein